MTARRNRGSIVSSPGAPALLASSIIARLPLAMFSIALLVNARHVTGSFAAAGLVSGAYAISSAFSAPLAGRLVDRFGQTRVLTCGATITALVLVTTGLLPSGTAPVVLVALAAATGLSTPPLEASVRTLLPVIASDPERLPELFAFESTVLELTYVFGPPLALGLGAVWSTGAALAVSGLVMLVGTLVFAAQPASRRWQRPVDVPRPRGGSLSSPAIRALVLILVGTGTVFGATEVGVTAAVRALGSTAAGAPLLALWGLGSLLGGIVATRHGGGARRATGLVALLAALAAGHGALAFTTGSVVAIGAVILLAGATIAPTEATISMMVDRAAPDGARTEAFSWLFTASLCGAALGAAVAGGLVQSSGAGAAFAFAGVAGMLTVAIAVIGARAIDRGTGNRPALVPAPACTG